MKLNGLNRKIDYWAAGVAVTIVVALPVSATSQEAGAPGTAVSERLRVWLAAVSQHDPGEKDAALNQIAVWPRIRDSATCSHGCNLTQLRSIS